MPLGHRSLLTLDYVLQPVLLDAGVYAFWLGTPEARIEAIDTQKQTGSPRARADDARQSVFAFEPLGAHAGHRAAARGHGAVELQRGALSRISARAAHGSRRATARLLAKKEELGAAIKTRVESACAAFGVAVMATGIRDIILPGEMRTILNQVIEAEKRAAANLIARREETAATRNLMNTAKMLGRTRL